jgi:chromosome segregation ATPase
VSDGPRRVPDNDDASKGSTKYRVKSAAHDTSSEGEVVRLEHERLADLEQQLSASLAAQIERDRRIVQLTDDLALKSALLEESETNAAQAKKRAGLELRELQAKLDDLLLSRDRAPEQAQSALQKATSQAADADDRSQRYKTELAEVRAELEGKKSELEAIRSRLMDAENSWSKSRSEAEKMPSLTPDSVDEDRFARRIMQRMRAIEAEIASLRGNEKSFEMMECTNE